MRGKILSLLCRPDARTGRAPRPTAAAALTRRSCRPTMFCIKFFRSKFFISSSISFTLFFSERWQDCLTCEWGAGLNGNGKVGWGSNEGTEVKCHFYSERYVPPSNRLLVQKEMFVRSKFTAITLSLFIVMCLLGLLALISVSLNVIKAQEGVKIVSSIICLPISCLWIWEGNIVIPGWDWLNFSARHLPLSSKAKVMSWRMYSLPIASRDPPVAAKTLYLILQI